MTEVYIAIVLQIGTLLGLLITALVGRRKVDAVHELVNGTSSAQLQQIEHLKGEVAYLKGEADRRKGGRPKKETSPPHDSAVGCGCCLRQRASWPPIISARCTQVLVRQRHLYTDFV